MYAQSLMLVVCSGLAHAVWNLFAKRSEEKSVFLWAILLPVTVCLLPLFVAELVRTPFTLQGGLLIVLSLLLQAGYGLLLTETYKYGDLSQVYPIMRGTSTLLVPVIGVALLGETLSDWGWFGLICILAGMFAMSGWKSGKGASAPGLKPVALALSVGICITCYVTVDKLNLAHYSPLFLLETGNIGFMLGLTPAIMSVSGLKRKITANARLIAIGSLLNPGSYLLFLLAMRLSPISHISPLREMGIVFGTALGIIVLKEKQSALRIASSALVAAGIIVIALFGP